MTCLIAALTWIGALVAGFAVPCGVSDARENAILAALATASGASVVVAFVRSTAEPSPVLALLLGGAVGVIWFSTAALIAEGKCWFTF